MSKQLKEYLDINVYEAAKQRLQDIYDSFDTIFVAFSGGKDSLVVLDMVERFYKEKGIKEKVNVIFRDEEVIPLEVVNFVQSIYHSGRFNFLYFCLQLKSEEYVLGKKRQYIQWDKNRKHMRPVPEFAITDWNNVYDQYTADERCTRGFPGKKCVITGVRAAESMTRLRAIVNKKNRPEIAETNYPNVFMGRIIYDFSEKDVFKYFYDHELSYCPIYDSQLFNRDELRVSTPLHAEASKRINKLKTLYPDYYNQIVSIFPDVELQARYYGDLDREGVIYRYPKSWDGIFQYINENLDKKNQIQAKRMVLRVKKYRDKMKGKPTDNYYGYPLLHVFKQVVNGNYKRQILPKPNPSKKEMEYEKLADL